jgi:hypothetical protein
MNIVDKILVDPITRGLKFFTKGGVPAYITQVRGRTDGSSPAAGEIGERLFSQTIRSSAIALTNAIAADIVSITLTPGIWLLFGHCGLDGGSGDVTTTRVEVSTVSATFGNVPSGYSGTGLDGSSWQMSTDTGLQSLANGDIGFAIPVITQNVSSSTTLYLVLQTSFSGSTANGYGRLEAVRIA